MLYSLISSTKPILFKILLLIPVVLISACGGGGGGGGNGSSTTSQAPLSLQEISGDDSLSAIEATGEVEISGRTGDSISNGSQATLSVNGKSYTSPVSNNNFSFTVSGEELAKAGEVLVSISDDQGKILAESTRSFEVASPKVTLSIDSTITSDNTLNLEEASQDILLEGSVEGDIINGDTVTLTVEEESYIATITDGQFAINFPGSTLAQATKIVASIETTTGSDLGEATATDTLEYSVSLLPPEITIIYPWDNTTVDSSSLKVTGIIIDDKEITEVRVNNTPVIDITETTDIPELENAKQENPESHVMAFELEIILSVGDTLLSITATDNAGNLTTESRSAKRIFDVPDYLLDDHANNRYIGPEPKIDWSGFWVTINKNTPQTASVLSPQSIPGSIYALDSQSGTIYSAKRSYNGEYISLHKTQINDFSSTTLTTINESTIPEDWSLTGLFDLVLDDTGETLYLLDLLIPPNEGAWQPIIYSYHIPSNNLQVLSQVDEEDQITGTKIELTDDALLLLIGSRNREGVEELIRIDLETGARDVFISDLPFKPTDFVVDKENNLAYLLALGAKDTLILDLSNKSISSIPTSSEDALEFYLPQPRDLKLDKENNRLLVGDSDLPYITTIDLTIGKRGALTNNNRVGSGVPFISLTDMSITSDGSTAYVITKATGTTLKLLSVDLHTGHRSIIFEFPYGTSESNISLSINEETMTAYMSNSSSIYLINLETGGSSILASSSIGFGVDYESIQASTLKNDSELLVAYDDHFLLSLNLSTLNRSYIADIEIEDSIQSIVYDLSSDKVYLSTPTEGIFSITLEEGISSLEINNCFDENNENWLASTLGHYRNMKLSDNTLLLSSSQAQGSYALVTLNDNPSCKVNSQTYLLDGEYSPSGTIIGLHIDKIIEIEPSTGGISIVSK